MLLQQFAILILKDPITRLLVGTLCIGMLIAIKLQPRFVGWVEERNEILFLARAYLLDMGMTRSLSRDTVDVIGKMYKKLPRERKQILRDKLPADYLHPDHWVDSGRIIVKEICQNYHDPVKEVPLAYEDDVFYQELRKYIEE